MQPRLALHVLFRHLATLRGSNDIMTTSIWKMRVLMVNDVGLFGAIVIHQYDQRELK